MSDNDNRWADIDDAGYWHAPEAEEKPDGPAVTDDISQEEKKEEPLVKLSSGTFIEPSMGFEFNKQCKVRIKVDYLDESARNMKKVNFSLFSKYLGKTANLNVSKDGYEQDGYAEADVTLYYPSTYDEEKDRNVKYFFRATHRRGDKAVDSIELNMPQPLHFVELKKDDYDENGADKYNKEKDGDKYKEKQVVTELQKNLVTLGFLADSEDATDGYFGDTTDTAVREFQDYAIKTDRMKRSKGKIEQADKALDQSGPDGIVGKKTADEIDLWLRKDWVKPEITLRHGEYDDTGVRNGKGKTGTDDHHKCTPVVKAQENLQKVEVYTGYAVDGWFHDRMYEAVKQFQEAAAEGKFLIGNVLTDIGEKLTGHVKGSYCPKTRSYLQKVVEKKGVVKLSDMDLNKKYADIMRDLEGKPYVTGANGPDSFDCSGAACWGIRKTANSIFGDYSAHDLFNKFTKESNYTGPGSLRFYDYTSDGRIDHVTIIMEATKMLHPSSGAGVIQVKPVDYLNSYTKEKGGVIYNRCWNWDAIER
jgi:cell wall-associated NlpC family hydrolase